MVWVSWSRMPTGKVEDGWNQYLSAKPLHNQFQSSRNAIQPHSSFKSGRFHHICLKWRALQAEVVINSPFWSLRTYVGVAVVSYNTAHCWRLLKLSCVYSTSGLPSTLFCTLWNLDNDFIRFSMIAELFTVSIYEKCSSWNVADNNKAEFLTWGYRREPPLKSSRHND